MDKKRKKTIWILCFLAFVLIPVTGITIAMNGPFLHKSLSRITGDEKLFGRLIFFGNLVIIFLMLSISYLFHYHNVGNRRTRLSFIIAAILLEITVVVPYVPSEFPELAKIHNFTAFTSVILLAFTVFWLIMTMPAISRKVYEISIIGLALVLTLCASILKQAGNSSSFFELVLIISFSDLILLMMFLLYKSEDQKEKGTFKVKYRIKSKKIKYFAYDDNYVYDNNMTKLEKWHLLKQNFRLKLFNFLFIYHDINIDKPIIGLANKTKNDKASLIINSEKQKFIIFDIDDRHEKTKEKTLDFINNQFDEFKLDTSNYFEVYCITFLSNMRRRQIWIPINEL